MEKGATLGTAGSQPNRGKLQANEKKNATQYNGWRLRIAPLQLPRRLHLHEHLHKHPHNTYIHTSIYALTHTTLHPPTHLPHTYTHAFILKVTYITHTDNYKVWMRMAPGASHFNAAHHGAALLEKR